MGANTCADYPRFVPPKSKQRDAYRHTLRRSPGFSRICKVIFRRALLREFSNLAIAVFATLFAITLSTLLIRLLGQAAIGKVLSEGVLALLAF